MRNTLLNARHWLLLLVCLLYSLPNWAEDYTEDGIVYDIDASTHTAKVKGIENNSIKSAVIKNKVEGCDVTSIGNYAFWNCSSLTSVEIPNSVTSIGNKAFWNCSSLTSVEIPNSVTSIGNYTFQDCSSLTSAEIPNSVTSIGNYAFWNCSSLISMEIPNSVTNIGYGVFVYCI